MNHIEQSGEEITDRAEQLLQAAFTLRLAGRRGDDDDRLRAGGRLAAAGIRLRGLRRRWLRAAGIAGRSGLTGRSRLTGRSGNRNVDDSDVALCLHVCVMRAGYNSGKEAEAAAKCDCKCFEHGIFHFFTSSITCLSVELTVCEWACMDNFSTHFLNGQEKNVKKFIIGYKFRNIFNNFVIFLQKEC